MTWLIKSLFWQITTPMETHFSSVKREKKKKKSRNENWLDTASKFYIHGNFQWITKVIVVLDTFSQNWQSGQFCQFCFYWFLFSLSSQLLILSFAGGYLIFSSDYHFSSYILFLSLLVPILKNASRFGQCRYIRNGESWRGKRQE